MTTRSKVAMQQFSGTSLKTRLYLLVLAAFVPVAILIFYITEEQKDIETKAFLHKAVVLAQAAANEENQQLESTRDLLSTVAEAFLMVEGRTDRLSFFLADLYKNSKRHEAFGIIDRDGGLLAGSNQNMAAQDFSSQSWFIRCKERNAWTIGVYQGDLINGEPVLYVALPIINRHKKPIAVAFSAINLSQMVQTVFKLLAELPKESRLTLLEETLGMLRYEVDTGQWSTPQYFNTSLRRKIISLKSGTLSAADEKGELRIYAFAPLAGFFSDRRVTIVLEIPQKIALAASRRIFIRNITLLLASALIAVLSIWWAGNVLILNRVRSMVAATRKLTGGDLTARIGNLGEKDELHHLASVFDEMAASLQMRLEREHQVLTSLEKSREQLRKLAAYQQEVREQERIRIAREIHDQLGQSLTILKMDLSWLKKQLPEKLPKAAEKMATMFGVIDEALKSLHAVTAELRPVILDDFGLAAAVEWQVEEFIKRSGIACRFENNGLEPDLPKEQATAVFRIFQEILTNILRHAGAAKVTVHLASSHGELMLQVQDNGRGITAAEINDPKSFGLLGIRERLYPWNGHVAFEGRPGKGTCVTLYLPMPQKGAST